MSEEEEGFRPASDSLPPSALELAKLAALLMRAEAGNARSGAARSARLVGDRRFATRDALLKAVRFHLEAAILYEELSGMSEESLMTLLLNSNRTFDHLDHLFGSHWLSSSGERYTLYKDGIQSSHPNLIKEFKNGFDQARRYLQRNGSVHSWGRSSTVLNNIFKYFEEHARRYNTLHASAIAGFEQEVSRMAAEMGVPEDELFEWRFRDDPRRAMDGKSLCESFLRIVSIRDYAASPSGASRVSRQVIGWALPVDFLNVFIKWRNAQKRPTRNAADSAK